MTDRKFKTREELIDELNTYHSDEFVVMFLGWMQFKVGYANGVTPEQVLAAWSEFKTEMGKRGVA